MVSDRDRACLRTGVVVIGRNEGERLRRCLESVLAAEPAAVVYVDSGSSDGSPALARNHGVSVIELDPQRPFSAARGRNAGFEFLIAAHPGIEFVQCIDGDCELRVGWLDAAVATLDRESDCAIVAGWLRERSPERSIYNRLADLEWNFSGAGEVDAVGGIFLARLGVLAQHGGFDPTIAAGEEPELCARLRASRWRIRRIDAEMALHDLAMTRFGQWWRRSVRFGYSCLDVAIRHGLPSNRRANLRARAWGLWAVMLTLTGGFAWIENNGVASAAFLGLLGVWPVQMIRIARRSGDQGTPLQVAWFYAHYVMLSNFPHLAGQILWLLDRVRGRGMRLIEHKTTPSETMTIWPEQPEHRP